LQHKNHLSNLLEDRRNPVAESSRYILDARHDISVLEERSANLTNYGHLEIPSLPRRKHTASPFQRSVGLEKQWLFTARTELGGQNIDHVLDKRTARM
jgi:hypothetical protein